MISRSDQPATRPDSHIVPAGGLASPPADPPAASGKPLQGQLETNKNLPPSDETPSTASSMTGEDAALWRAAAMQLGTNSYRRHAGEPLTFENAEDELSREWELGQHAQQRRVSWDQARECARDAWDQARNALASGDAKPSAR